MSKERKRVFGSFLRICVRFQISDVARAFPGGRAAHPEDQNEEGN